MVSHKIMIVLFLFLAASSRHTMLPCYCSHDTIMLIIYSCTVFSDGAAGNDRCLVPQRCLAILRKGKAAAHGFVSFVLLLVNQKIEGANFCEPEINEKC